MMEAMKRYLFYRNKLLKHLKPLKTPNVTNLEINNTCSLDCRGCPRHQMTRDVSNMDWGTFTNAVEQILTHSYPPFVWLHHFGDPLLHPNLIDFINYAEEQGLNVGIGTKGHLLTDNMITELVNSKLSKVLFSFLATGEFDIVPAIERDQNINYNKTSGKINQFINQQKDEFSLMDIRVQLITDGNQDTEGFKTQWGEFADIKPAHGWIGDDSRVTTVTESIHYTTKSCPSLWFGDLAVLWNGDVVPCCRDYDGKEVLGNITRNSLEEIWNGKRMNELRILHKEGRRNEVELCKNCGAEGAFK